jgi:predicted RNase H-like nuclease (RuvC/YqgF family)
MMNPGQPSFSERLRTLLNLQDPAIVNRILVFGLIGVALVLSAFTVVFYTQASRESTNKAEALKTNQELQAEIKQLDAANQEKDATLRERDAQIAQKATELASKDALLAEISRTLKAANGRLAQLQKQTTADQRKIRDYQTRMNEYEERFNSLNTELASLKEERDADRRRLRELSGQVQELDQELAAQRAQNEKLQGTLRTTWRCTDFEFVAGGKKVKNISFKKGKLSDFTIQFLVKEATTGKLVTNGTDKLDVLVKGISDNNRDFKRTFAVTRMSGNKTIVHIQKEKFEKGLYRVEVLKNNAVIGDTKFRADAVL